MRLDPDKEYFKMWTTLQRLFWREPRPVGPSAQDVAAFLGEWPYATAPLLLVVGSAGTGKSTLVREVVARLAAQGARTLAAAEDVQSDFWVQAEARSPWLATHRYDWRRRLGYDSSGGETAQAMRLGIARAALGQAIVDKAQFLILDYQELEGTTLQAFHRLAREAAPGLGVIVVEQSLERLQPVLAEVDALVLFSSWEWPLPLPGWVAETSEARTAPAIERTALLSAGHGPLRFYRRVQRRDRARASTPQ